MIRLRQNLEAISKCENPTRCLPTSSPLPLSSRQASSPKAASSLSLSRYQSQMDDQFTNFSFPQLAPRNNLDFCKPTTSSWNNLTGDFEVLAPSAPHCCHTWLLSHQVDLTCRIGGNLYVPEYTECRKNKEVISCIKSSFKPISVLQIEKVAWIWVIAFAFAAPQVIIIDN